MIKRKGNLSSVALFKNEEMKTQEGLRQLYQAELKPHLKEMEGDRKHIKKWRRRSLIAFILFLLSLVFILSQRNNLILSAFLFVIPLLALVLAGLFLAHAYLRLAKYRKEFKERVMHKVVKLINPDYIYKEDNHIPIDDYLSSNLFSNIHDRYNGDDLITGIIDKTPFSFSEVKADAKKDKNKPDEQVAIWKTIFKGLFFVAEFNKNLNESTYIVPEKAHKNLLGKEKTQIANWGELVKLENPEFEKIFSVYGSSQQEARYVLTPTMMEAIIEVYKKYNLKMMFSFTGSKVYCAIPMKKDMFEPTIKEGIKYSDIEEISHLLELIETIITEMNLNTRIWTKK